MRIKTPGHLRRVIRILQIEDNPLEITMALPSLVAQTTYAELLERRANAAFKDAFADDGAFISKTIKGRKYWYFQTRTGETRTQRPETPELLTQTR